MRRRSRGGEEGMRKGRKGERRSDGEVKRGKGGEMEWRR